MSVDILLAGLHSLFFEGRSNVREYIFLFLLLFLSLIFYFIKRTRQTSKNYHLKTAIILITLSWLMLHILTTTTQIFIFQKNDLPLSTYGLFIDGVDITSSAITHNHVGKTYTSILFKTFHKNKALANIDLGGGLDNLIPGHLKLFGLIIFLFFVVPNIYIFLKQTPDKNWLWPIAFSLILFATLKGLIDGGIFSRSQIIDFSILIAMLLPQKRYRILLIGLLFSVLVYNLLYVFNISSEDSLILSIKMAVMSSLFGFGLIILLNEQSIRLRILSSILILFSVITAGFTQVSTINYEEIKITPSDRIHILSADNNILEVINHATTTIKKIAKEKKLLTNRMPVQIPWKTCVPSAPYYNYILTILDFSKNEYSLNNTGDVKIEKIGADKYKINLSIAPCTPSPMNAMHLKLRQAGLNSYLIYNMTEVTSKQK